MKQVSIYSGWNYTKDGKCVFGRSGFDYYEIFNDKKELIKIPIPEGEGISVPENATSEEISKIIDEHIRK